MEHDDEVPNPDEIIIIEADLLDRASPEEREAYFQYLVQEVKRVDAWEPWLKLLFPQFAGLPFSPGHVEFWEWVWKVSETNKPRPWVSIWPRGHGKSTSAELAVAALAARGKRKYGLYICETQDQADDHVANIASMLESTNVELAYPDLGTPAVNKQGQSKGWRRNRIVTASGFILDACGLDSAARGIKFEAQRPDFMVFDDVDGELDGEAMTLKKIKVITQKLLPAGSSNCAVLMVQNLVHKQSIFARLCSKGLEDEPEIADFLRNRIVSGPIPAVEGLEVEEREIEEDDGEKILKWVITAGVATWPEGFPISACEALINEFGLSAFMAECQHITEPPDGDIFSHLKYVHISHDLVPRMKRVVVWVDPAVSSNDTSDCMGIQIDGLGVDGKIYRLWSWEQRATPYEAMKKAIRKAIEFKATVIGIETNQGDQLWRVVYDQAMEDVRIEKAREIDPLTGKKGDFFQKMPRYKEKKATKDLGSKITRAERMLVDYERHIFVHVEGTHETLERSLKRFPKVKPFDLVDACYWSWSELAGPLHRRKMKLSSSARKALSTGMGVTGAPTRPIGL